MSTGGPPGATQPKGTIEIDNPSNSDPIGRCFTASGRITDENKAIVAFFYLDGGGGTGPHYGTNPVTNLTDWTVEFELPAGTSGSGWILHVEAADATSEPAEMDYTILDQCP